MNITTVLETYLHKAPGRVKKMIPAGLKCRVKEGLPAHWYYRLGQKYVSKELWREAVVAFKEAVKSKRCPAEVHAALADAYLKLKEYENAAAAYIAALMKDDQQAKWHYELGKIRRKLKEWQYAAASFKEAVELDSSHAEWFAKLALMYQKQKRWKEAEESYRLALEKESRAAWWYDFAMVHVRKGQLDDAIDALCKATMFPDVTTEWFYQLGGLYQKQGRWEEAAGAFRVAVDKDSRQPDWFFSLSVSYQKLGRIEEAIAALRQAIQLDDRSPKRYIKLSELYQKQKDWTRASDALERAVEGDGSKPEWYYRLGELYRKQERWTEVLRALDHAIERDPRNVQWHFELEQAKKIAGLYPFEPSEIGLAGHVELYSTDFGAFYMRTYCGERLKLWERDLGVLETVAGQVPIPSHVAFKKTVLNQNCAYIALEKIPFRTIAEARLTGHFNDEPDEFEAFAQGLKRWHKMPLVELASKMDSDFWKARFASLNKYLVYLDEDLGSRLEDLLNTIISDGDLKPQVMSHGDLHFSNVLYDQGESKCYFIDLEKICSRSYSLELAELLYMLMGHRDENSLARLILKERDREVVAPVTVESFENVLMPLCFSEYSLQNDRRVLLSFALYVLWKALYALSPNWCSSGNHDYAARKKIIIWQRYSYFKQQFEVVSQLIDGVSSLALHEALVAVQSQKLPSKLS